MDLVLPGRAAGLFPLAGAVLGAIGAGVYLPMAGAFGTSAAALATVAFWSSIPALLREEGLVNFTDALHARRAGLWIAILLSAAARWKALSLLATPHVLETLVAAQAVPRAAMVGMAWCSRPSGPRLPYALASALSTPAALAAIVSGAAAAFLCGWRAGFAIIALSVLIVQASRAWFYKRAGGVNPDGLSLTEQLIEIAILTMFACGSCAW